MDASLRPSPAHREEQFRIGAWVLTPAHNTLERAPTVHKLEPRAAEFLAFLAARPGQVVSVETLMAELWADRIVTDASVYRIIAQLRRLLGDDTREPAFIETVRKRGYRLIAPVERIPRGPAPELMPASAASVGSHPESARRLRTRLWLPLAAASLAVGAIAGWTLFDPDEASEAPTTVAVLPFESLSDDGPDYVSRGLTRTLTDRLASIEDLSVIAYQSARAYEGTDASARAVAAELGADLLVTGSIITRSSGGDTSTARVTVSLVDPRTRRTRWTRSYEGEVGELVDVQARFAEQLARALDLELLAPRRRRDLVRRTASVEAWRLYAEGEEMLDKGYQAQVLERSIDRFSRALDLEPNMEAALVGRATAHLRLYYNYHDRSEARMGKARADVHAALRLNPNGARSHQVLGQLHLVTGDHKKSFGAYRRALELQPSRVEALAGLGQAYCRRGRLVEAIETISEAVRLDPLSARHAYNLGVALAMAGRFAEAERAYRKALARAPDMLEAYLYNAILYLSWLGDPVAAQRPIDVLRERIGMDALLAALVQPGLWSIFTFLDERYHKALRAWSPTDSEGEVSSWHFAMGSRAFTQDNLEEARRHFAEAARLREADVAHRPTDPWMIAELGMAYAGLGRAREAIEAADRALALAPIAEDLWNNADFMWTKATVLAMLGRDHEVIQQIAEASWFPSMVTPAYVGAVPVWSDLVEQEAFVALTTDDGARWRAQRPGALGGVVYP